ncbi:MAG: HipA-like protein [Nostocales cyanobacterium]|nr:MAG: HipA-like protein [Nostocales cyanobacterium]
MSDPFPVIEVPIDASQDIEDLGTKEKFWFTDPNLGLCLFKKARLNTGEDWAEKIASELCELLGVPHANYELATFNGENGIISPSFIPESSLELDNENSRTYREYETSLGNDILAETVSNYPKHLKNPSQHTIENVFDAIGNSTANLPINWTPPDGITTAVETFVGYLLLDAWIGNSDRHHENWALIRKADKSDTYLAPTYDHASSMGRELRDNKRKSKLDNQSVIGYVEKCSSVLYASVNDSTTLKTVEAFREAKQRYLNAGNLWLDNLAKVSSNDTLEIFERIPSDRISPTAIEFAQKILELNQNRLLILKEN